MVRGLVGLQSRLSSALRAEARDRTLPLCTTCVNWCQRMSSQKVGNQVRIVSYYSPEALEQLKLLCANTRIPQSVYMREALDDLLKKYAATLRPATAQRKRSKAD